MVQTFDLLRLNSYSVFKAHLHTLTYKKFQEVLSSSEILEMGVLILISAIENGTTNVVTFVLFFISMFFSF